ncbi:ABC transporter substrate-binding protein [Streptomyces sp. NPDC020807]|uniref:ABC transporter substrate-binding protein n=1 Tax=Streptomyces sp. NPDC020807 TaxID=3155119 RepID=UPI00340CDE76
MGNKKTTALSGAVLAAVMLTLSACGGGGGGATGEVAAPPSDPKEVSGKIKVLTQRTDLVQNGVLKQYAAEFQKIYPKVEVSFDGITDYEGEVKIRMNTKEYGDVLFIPGAVAKNDYPKFFAPLGTTAELSKYRFGDKAEVDGKVYGIAQFGTADGFVYNKKLWRQAGVTEWPKTPEEFLADLKAIKAKTGATPYYTNFKDGWPLVQWTSNLGVVGCDAQASNALAGPVSPWKSGSELNTTDTLLYDIVKQGLSEKDPATTNWEISKALLGEGEIATMMLGSWSITQMQAAAVEAGGKASDIGFMPFPAQKNGKHCAALVSDYQQAVSVYSKNKSAARAWVDWFTEKSGFAEKEGVVSAVKSAPMPATLKEFVDNDVSFFDRSEAKTATVNDIDEAAEIGLNKQDYRQKMIDIATGAEKGSLEDFFADLNKRWDEAAKTVGS